MTGKTNVFYANWTRYHWILVFMLLCLLYGLGLVDTNVVRAQNVDDLDNINLTVPYNIDVKWLPNDQTQFALSTSPLNDIYILDQDYNLLQVLDPNTDSYFANYPYAFGPTELMWSPDGNYLAVQLDSVEFFYIQIWDVSTGVPTTVFQGRPGLITWHPQLPIIAIADYRTGITLVDVVAGTSQTFAYSPGVDDSFQLAFSPDGSQITTVTTKFTIESRDIVTGDILFALSDRPYYNFAWDPSGEALAVLTENRQIEIWNVSSGMLLKSMPSPNLSEMQWVDNGIVINTNQYISIVDVDTGDVQSVVEFTDFRRINSVSYDPIRQRIFYTTFETGTINPSFSQVAQFSDINPPVTCSITVSTPTDLISAINTANGSPEAETVCLDAGTYTFTAADNTLYGDNALPVITDSMTLYGLGDGATLTRDSADLFRFFYVDAGTDVTFENLTLSNGDIGTSVHGGAIYTKGNTTLRNVTLSGNNAKRGGGIRMNGAILTLEDTLFEGNTGNAVYAVSGDDE